jgi:predicted enzyme related to lactoylglutathione lyase
MKYKLSRCICITHPDHEGMVSFYRDVLGITPTTVDHGSKEFVTEHIKLYLDHADEPATYFELIVEDLEEARKDMLDRGCTIVTWGGLGKANYVRDPFGVVFNLWQEPLV